MRRRIKREKRVKKKWRRGRDRKGLEVREGGGKDRRCWGGARKHGSVLERSVLMEKMIWIRMIRMMTISVARYILINNIDFFLKFTYDLSKAFLYKMTSTFFLLR